MRILINASSYTYWGELDPRKLFDPNGTQLGGGETAALYTAIELSKLGHTVLVCGHVPRPVKYKEWPNLRIVPVSYLYYAACSEIYDVTVAWDSPQIYTFNFPTRLRLVAYQLNDTDVGMLDHVIDGYFHPSRWHADRFHTVYSIPVEKQYSGMTNGYDPVFVKREEQCPKESVVLYCSSPDRGLHHVLRMWPKIREEVPNAELHIYYDMTKWVRTVETALKAGQVLITTDRALAIRDALPKLSSLGVRHLGGVSKVRLYDAMDHAAVLAYPCDPVAPTEGYSMTIVDALAHNLPVVTSDADALSELWGGINGTTILPLPIDDETWIRKIVYDLQHKDDVRQLEAGVAKYAWETLAQEWERTFTTLLEELKR